MKDNKKEELVYYTAFAAIYDRVMRDVDYHNWAEHVIRLAKRYKLKGKKWLDLACGTGSTSLEMIPRGYEMTGIDFADEMLAVAAEKAGEEGYKLPLFQGRMEKFAREELSTDFDMVICLYDSLNYLTEREDVKSCFREVNRHLRPGGGFIVDITTEYNLLHNFAGYTFAENFDDASYIWENAYSIVTKLCTSKVSIFMRSGGKYEKVIEQHNQRVYSLGDLMQWLEDAGFENLGQFKDVSMEPPEPKCERVHLVAKKVRDLSSS